MADTKKMTTRDYITHIAAAVVAAALSGAGTWWGTKPTQAPQTAPQAAPVTPETTTPAVVRAEVVRIEAGRVELVGTVTVSIPEIKQPPAPNVTVGNTLILPADVADALARPIPTPTVKVDNYIDPRAVVVPPEPTGLLPIKPPARNWTKEE